MTSELFRPCTTMTITGQVTAYILAEGIEHPTTGKRGGPMLLVSSEIRHDIPPVP